MGFWRHPWSAMSGENQHFRLCEKVVLFSFAAEELQFLPVFLLTYRPASQRIKVQQNFILKDKYMNSVQGGYLPGPTWQGAQGQSRQGRRCLNSQLRLSGLGVLIFLRCPVSQGCSVLCKFCSDSHADNHPLAVLLANIQRNLGKCLTLWEA